jgi:CheY-like chemotaxis protein/two-component sensor histidine kinase
VKLVDDLLDVSRITTGKLRLAKKVTDLAVVAEAALESIRPVAESRGVAVHGSVQPVEPVLGDADRLQQVVWNLLANAVKFTPAGGEVRLIVESDPAGGGCVVRVADTGRGIDPQFLPYVFDRFRQADSSSTRSHGGLGIGLTIVRHIVELHGGTVEAASAGAGHGATFTVRLPATSVAASGDADAAVPPPELADRPPVARSQRAEPSAAVLPEARRLEGRKIVIVEDEPDARALLAELLRRQGAKVLVAGSVLDGLNHFGAGPPDLLISDLAMPGEDGFSLISRVRGLPAASGGAVPAVAVSAYAREEDRRRSLAAGFDDHVSKPVDPAELIDIIARLAGSRDMAATSAAEPAIAAAP